MRQLVAVVTLIAFVAAGCGRKKSSPAGGGSAAVQGGGTGATTGTEAASAPDPARDAVDAANAAVTAALVVPTTATSATDVVNRAVDAGIAALGTPDRTAWDPAAVVAAVGTDRAALFAWVRDRTALVPYRGSLRGSVGVVMDRVGNSLDRSLLLADLLVHAGLEVRLAHATLDDATVARVTATLTRARPALPAPHPLDRAGALTKLAQAIGADPAPIAGKLAAYDTALAALRKRTDTRIAAQATALATLVPAADAPALDPAVLADHYWVQVHDGEAWSDLDPTLPDAQPGEPLAANPSDTLAPADLPDDMRHTLTVRVIGEVWHGDARDQPVLLEHRFAPSLFFGQRIALSNMPVDWPDADSLLAVPDPGKAARDALVAQTEWIPILMVGGTPVVHFSVTDGGELYDLMDPDANTNRLARVVQRATKEGVGGATDLLGTLPDQAGAEAGAPPIAHDHTAFTAEWLELQIDSPGASPFIQRRVVFDTTGNGDARPAAPPPPLSPAARLDRAYALVGETELLPLFARLPEAFVADRAIKALTAAKPVLAEMAALGNKPPTKQLREHAAGLVPMPGILAALALARFAWSPVADRVFLDRVNVMAHSVRGTGPGRTREGFDVIANHVAVWPGTPEPRAAAIAQGIADTAVESLTLPCPPGTCTRWGNASDDFAAANNTGWSVATADAVVPGARVHARRDAELGYQLIAAAGGGTWWRIDPATGETLGMSPGGGNTFVETLKQMALTMLSGVFCFWNWTPDQPGWHLIACIVGTGMGFVGGAIGAGSATAARIGMDWFLSILGAIINGVGGHNFGD